MTGAISDAILDTPSLVGPAIAASWLTLRVTGCRRPGGDWIDLAGRIVGWYWIVACPAGYWWTLV